MSQQADWRATLDDIDARLLDTYQSGVPLTPDPFAAIGAALGIDADETLDRVQGLFDRGLLRRFGPVLNPPVIGSSTLAALSAPEERFDAVAETVNAHPQVNHNYRRDHAWNMWFVVTAGTRERRDAIIDEIAAETGLEPLVLPMCTDYYIDLEFPVVTTDRVADASANTTDASVSRIEDAAATLSPFEAELLLALQEGLPLERHPYTAVADDLGVETERVIAGIEHLLERNCIKRVGLVVNHRAVGFDNNCMVVWDVPDADRDERGLAAGDQACVTLCYHRPRRPKQDWPYTLFTMVHGRDGDAVDETIDWLAAEVLPYDHERLYSTATLKQTGARYERLVGAK
jgi:DNA-binding Lrp family transcriptional regulator